MKRRNFPFFAKCPYFLGKSLNVFGRNNDPSKCKAQFMSR